MRILSPQVVVINRSPKMRASDFSAVDVYCNRISVAYRIAAICAQTR